MNALAALIARLTNPPPTITETELDQKIRGIANDVFTERIKTWED